MPPPSASDVAATQSYRGIRKFTRKMAMKTIPALTANKLSTIEWDRGLTYHRIYLQPTIGGVPVVAADVKSYLGKVRGIIDGDAKIDESADQIIAAQDYHNGRNVTTCYQDGLLCIHLAQPWQDPGGPQDFPAWGMAVGGPNGVKNATLSVMSTDLAKIDNIQAWTEVSDATYLGRHFRRYHILGNQAAAGDLLIDQWPIKDPTAVIQSMHVKTTHITDVRLNVDKGDDIEKCPIALLHQEARQLGKVPQTGWTHIGFDNRGRPMDGMPVVFQNGRLTLTTDQALGDYDIVLDVLEGIDP